MRTQSPDTSPEAERVQIELVRKLSVAQRVALTRSLTRTVIQLSRRAIRNAHPHMDEDALRVKFVELNYGPELAEQFRAALARRRDGHA